MWKRDKKPKNMIQTTTNAQTVAGVWEEFLRETSFHGCRNIRSGRRSIIQRIVWTVMLLVMSGMLLRLLIDMYAVYRSYPFKTVTSLKRHVELDFPAISVCRFNSYYASKLNISREWSRYLYSQVVGGMFGSLNISKPADYAALPDDYDEFWIPKEDFILWAMAGKTTLNVSRDFKKAGLSCFSFNTLSADGDLERFRVRQSEGLHLLLNIQADEYIAPVYTEGAQILIHDPHEIQFRDEQLVMVEPGTFSRIKLTQTSFKFLPLPYKSFGSGEETCDDVYSAGFKHSLRYYDNYTMLSCFIECRFIPVVEKCGCRYGAHLGKKR
ncbi:acid-sensing ion channel 2-like [Gigantopelta aegis]|uniref:acid-sensing ion channel 2-like n=1 Tax=Gigantopelta aegis TaxID=1735272 RepID=UPI001B88851C|nr:acid-sensing ion channel 2-like [Gigantopelta aegis]